MPADEPDEPSGEGRSSGVLAGLLAPLRLPERVLEALDELRPMHMELARVRRQTASLGDLLPALQRLQDVLGARIDAVHGVVEDLRPMPAELVRVREQTDLQPSLQRLQDVLGDRLDALHEVVVALESDESHLNVTTRDMGTKVEVLSNALEPVGDRLVTIERAVQALAVEVGAIHETVGEVKEDIQRITGLRGERGVMERARDALTGNNDEQDKAGT